MRQRLWGRLIGAALVALLVLAGSAAWSGQLAPYAATPALTASVGDVVLGYRIVGQGSPMLLITGYGCTMDTWDPDLIAALAAKHRLILMDNRGMGTSTASDAPFSMRLFAEDAAGLLKALGIERVDVLGWSMGAVTALELAVRHPELVGKVVAYGAAYEPGPVLAALERMRRMTPEEHLAQLFPARWAAAHPDALAHLPKPAIASRPEIVARQAEAIARWSGFGDRLDRLDKDVLLVVGQDDDVTAPAQSLTLAARIPGSWLVRFRDAGHWLMFQVPERLAQVVETFLTAGAQTAESVRPATAPARCD